MRTHFFSQALLTWFDQHGRHHLPWQLNPTPYRVWVSEIMLQQTQVNTVIPYFQRFIDRFSDIPSLANATQDEVLHLWSGLGYYARGRNLHKAAQFIAHELDGTFPDKIEEVIKLPGIGRSTAGAILAQAYQQRQPILDGNVKRVLCRFDAIRGWPGTAFIEKKLWQLSDQYTPQTRPRAYTQAIMDLGATVCIRSSPHCPLCPIQKLCLTRQQNFQAELPTPRPRKKRPTKTAFALILKNKKNEIYLEQRPSTGIWGGLWSFPELSNDKTLSEKNAHYLETQHHAFSHYHLKLTPIIIQTDKRSHTTQDSSTAIWYNPAHSNKLGLAAPVKQLLNQLFYKENSP
ncbi:MAG: A/G-specific adenine glycosylase [Gammaproteobacteria bacterium]|nr:A/G-specific adenine glycosylase [Gammaproteobacteria bacterium]